MTEAKLPLTHDTLSVFQLDEALGVNVNALVDAFREVEREPLKALGLLGEVRAAADALEAHAVRIARARGATWADLASPLGITRQAVRLRYPD